MASDRCDKQDRKWEAESDARSLLASQEIRKDEKRYARALKELAAIVAKAKKEAMSKEISAKLEKAIKE